MAISINVFEMIQSSQPGAWHTKATQYLFAMSLCLNSTWHARTFTNQKSHNKKKNVSCLVYLDELKTNRIAHLRTQKIGNLSNQEAIIMPKYRPSLPIFQVIKILLKEENSTPKDAVLHLLFYCICFSYCVINISQQVYFHNL